MLNLLTSTNLPTNAHDVKINAWVLIIITRFDLSNVFNKTISVFAIGFPIVYVNGTELNSNVYCRQ